MTILHEYNNYEYLIGDEGILSKLITYKKFSENDVRKIIERYCRRYKVSKEYKSDILFRNIKIQIYKLK